MINCPNCGAPLVGPKCEYCGTTVAPEIFTNDIFIDLLRQRQHELKCQLEISKLNACLSAQTASILSYTKESMRAKEATE